MIIAPRPVDDLKTERTDVAPPLAPYLRVVPFVFYAMLLAGAGLAAYNLYLLRDAAAAEQRWIAENNRLKAELVALQTERDSVERLARRGNEIAAWVRGSRTLQPLVVDIIRSMEAGSSIAELALARDPATPSQIRFTLRLNTQGVRQLEQTLQQVASNGFRAYSPNQTQGRGEIDYEATLIHLGSRGVAEGVPSTAPAPAAPTP